MTDHLAIPLALDLSAVAVGAVQGAVFAGRLAHERHLDIIGVVFVGVATGLGGGILRDVLLNLTPNALRINGYLLTVVTAALAGMLFAPLVNRLESLVVAIDAGALGMYLMVGVSKATALGLGTAPAIFVGVLACTGGSVIRDLLLRTEIALVRVGSLYVVAALGGAVAYVFAYHLTTAATAGVTAIAVTFGIRMLALWFGWRTPRPVSITTARQRGRN